MKILVFSIFLAVNSVWAGPSKPATPKTVQLDSETKSILKIVSERYKALGNWEATIKQENFSLGLCKGTVNQGKFYFVRPNKLKYSLMGPEHSDFITDGKKAWLFQFREGRAKPPHVKIFADVKKLEVDRYLMIVRGIDALSPKKEAEMLKDFEIKGRLLGDEMSLELAPRKSSEIIRITFFFKRTEQNVDRVIIEDAVGNTSKIEVVTWRAIDKVDETAFNVVVPPSAQVENY